MVLDKIRKPNDVRNLTEEELKRLPSEIRRFLINSISVTGGHLASNLGTVELTIALHLVMHFPEDKLIWDVGHQSYTHKILTGRKDRFDSLRKLGGLSGFPKPEESDCDAFGTGHASTSISAGLGFQRARELRHENYKIVSVIGDGALTGGLALEGLNNASLLKKNFVIVLNDNTMSISKNVGGMPEALARFRTNEKYTGLKENITNSLEKIPVYGDRIVKHIRKSKSGIKQLFIPGMLFEEMGIMYLGPVDGHNIKAMTEMFERAFTIQGPVIVHVITRKGLGYPPAERHPDRFHGTAPFDIKTGLPVEKKKPLYTDIFSTVMRKLGDRDQRIVAVTAAMESGTGLHRFHNMFPDRFVDVGIAEEHAVTLAAGMAEGGLIPVVAVYSSFLQRAYDEIVHDLAVHREHVILAVDRAGIVGRDGDTHQGIFDLSYLLSVPGMTIMAPKNKWELSDMLKAAVDFKGPVAIRYPKAPASLRMKTHRKKIELGKCEELRRGSKILFYAFGSMVETAADAADILMPYGICPTVVNARFASPLDKSYLLDASREYDLIVTLEENVRSGGFGEHVMALLNEKGYKGEIMIVSLPDSFIPQGSREELLQEYGLDAVDIADRVRNWTER